MKGEAARAAAAEERRLAEDRARTANWQRWGPYLSERQWGTVREDYSKDGKCWEYFPHDHARSRAYRWGEDGLLGFTDRECRLCFALALWNGRDPILKERLFGLSGPEGNHGEDVKELYYYLDSTPTHSWMRALYKYPQAEFPYDRLVEENGRRGLDAPEFELLDTGVFDGGRYFDVFAAYAKAAPDHILIRLTAANRGPAPAALHLLPTLWFRNLWSWGAAFDRLEARPRLEAAGEGLIAAAHPTLGPFQLRYAPASGGARPEPLFTENETNQARLFQAANASPYVKDAFHRRVVQGEAGAVNPGRVGTKAALHYVLALAPGEEQTVDLQLLPAEGAKPVEFGPAFARGLDRARREADEFYARVLPAETAPERAAVIRQGYAGLLWSKQFYHYVVEQWLDGDPDFPSPASRRQGRNRDWRHLFARDVVSMPDKWEYPWFAAWDLGFHLVVMAKIDPDFAKTQLLLLLREWYLHPNGQIPSYEFAFGEVNPPVHAWAAWRVYKIADARGRRDRAFLERVFQKLLLNFTWWVNRKDAEGKNLFSGGFLGLDNVGVFDRNQPIPGGGQLRQADATAWMAFFANTMLSIALELAQGEGGAVNLAYEDMASKFFEHFIQIVDAMNSAGGAGLWDDGDGFYYDQIDYGNRAVPLKTRSVVGLLPLIAVEVLDQDAIGRLPGFKKRYEWFLKNRPDLARLISYGAEDRTLGHRKTLLAVPSRDRLARVLRYVFDEAEFLSPHGIRSVSKYHEKHPFIFREEGCELRLDYTPAESATHLFGGNSNWRGPVWFPVNYLLAEALERYHEYFRDSLLVEMPVGSGRKVNLREASRELSRRLAGIFLPDARGRRPVHGEAALYAEDPHFRDLVLFYEYFHGDNGRGVGASHQTGWTALAVRLLEEG